MGINLPRLGCIRLFPTRFIGGVVDLYKGPACGRRGAARPCLRDLGLPQPAQEVIEVLTSGARFIYGPILDDRVRTIADGVSPGEYGRKEASACIRS